MQDKNITTIIKKALPLPVELVISSACGLTFGFRLWQECVLSVFPAFSRSSVFSSLHYLTPAFACAQPVSRFRSPQAVGSVFPRLVLFPTARPPLISKLPAHSRLPCFRCSHFSFPSAFTDLRTSSARLTFNLSAFLFPLDFHPPSGTSARFLSVARSRLFAFRPVSQAQFAFPAASLSLASFRRFPFPSVSFRYSAALSCCLLFRTYRPSKLTLHSPVSRFLLSCALRALSNPFRGFRCALSNTTSGIIRYKIHFVKHFFEKFYIFLLELTKSSRHPYIAALLSI